MLIFINNKMQLRNGKQYLNSELVELVLPANDLSVQKTPVQKLMDEIDILIKSYRERKDSEIIIFVLIKKIQLLINHSIRTEYYNELEKVISVYNIYNCIYKSFEIIVLFKDNYDLFIKMLLERIPVLTQQCLDKIEIENSEHTNMHLKCIKELAKVQKLANKIYYFL